MKNLKKIKIFTFITLVLFLIFENNSVMIANEKEESSP
ncbi:hypothetical protein BU595_12855, partial [Staphylococcus arlettae]